MIIRLVDGGASQEPVDGWPLPQLPAYVASRELGWLTRDLARYSRGRVLGRSYLVAGHRGAGKTALVQRAVDVVATETVRASVRELDETLGDRPFQRPVLVKLHGPSMLQEQPAAPAAGGAGGDPGAGTGAAAQSPPVGVPAALVHMTVGLYRALATEIATGYRAHATRLATGSADGEELAAQLVLDLDLGPDASVLSRYWTAIGRLRGGVLWPGNADRTLGRVGLQDQGLREITALATAGQAFQVCSGRVTYNATSKESLARTDAVEGAGSSDLREGLSRLATLGVGALSGAAVMGASGQPVVGLAAGVAVWLLGSLTMKWSWSTRRSGDRSIDYSFIRDREPATLDRELPVVIARVRQAGLAPVFAIDELDKVEDAAAKLIDLVGRLKHLIADFGFFCFLVNRDCFEALEARVQATAYPAEHTLFSDRLLLRPDAGSMFRYLLDRTQGNPADAQAPFARVVFALHTMHESRLNLTDMMRQLSRVTRADGSIGSSVDWGYTRQLVIATVQIAIDEVLRTPALVERMDANPVLGQLAIDALYYPSRR